MGATTFTFLSANKKTQIHCVSWESEEGVYKGILQICHGMMEYIERYEEFAKYMNSQGYLVVGHDHLGHGESVNSTEEWGYFSEKNGVDILISDMHTLRQKMQKKYPDLPYFMLGHSMGSFLIRRYLCEHNENLRGAIIMGTGAQTDSSVKFGKCLSSFLAKFYGWRHRSKLIAKMVFGGNNDRFRSENQKNSWLTKDTEKVEAYLREPKCTFGFTLSGYYTLFDTIWYANQKEHIEKTPKKLPLFFVAGEDDPVGDFGKGVKTVYDRYEEIGMLDITWKLYPNDRHEILNELDRALVYEDIYHWMEVRLTT